ncbi:MAG: TerB family tellurite resistance protein [Mariprofundaceae bacterium]|nr:TerB family tellurite resistance protein [Mariprofundaceae bacterium]
MLKTLKKMWGNPTSVSSKPKKHNISLAVTALMVQVMQQDDCLDDTEHQAIIQAIQERFNLSKEDAELRIKQAIQSSLKANDLQQFTAPLIKAYSEQERIDIIRQLWLVSMADGHIDAYEEALIRKVAELIGVHHYQFIDAKIKAKSGSNR